MGRVRAPGETLEEDAAGGEGGGVRGEAARAQHNGVVTRAPGREPNHRPRIV